MNQRNAYDSDSLKRTMGLNLDTLPIFANKDVAKMNQLLNDEDAFDIFFNDLEAVKNMKQVSKEMQKENATKASEIMKRKSEVDSTMAENEPLQAEFIKAKEQLQQSEVQYKSKMARFESTKLMERLKKSVEESEKQTSEVADSLLSGTLSVDEFLHLYKDMRKLYHLRAAKLDKAKSNSYVFPVFPQINDSGVRNLESRLSSLLKK